MTNQETARNQGTGLAGILTIIFVIAKILGYIDWSWWWVFSPLWIPISIVLGVALILGFFSLVIAAILDLWDAWDRKRAKKRAKMRRRR